METGATQQKRTSRATVQPDVVQSLRGARALAVWATALGMLLCGCDLERPYDPLNEYESHVWTAATAGLQTVPRPGIDDDKDWPYVESGIWPLFQDRAYFDGTRSQSMAWPLWQHVTTPDGLLLDNVFLLYRDARRPMPGGWMKQRTDFLWPFFHYRRKANETDYSVFPLVFWSTQVYPDARLKKAPELPSDTGRSMLGSALNLLGIDAAGTPYGEEFEGGSPPVAAEAVAGAPVYPQLQRGRPVFSRSSFSRTERPYDARRDHRRSRLWIFPVLFYADDTKLGHDLALIPVAGSISNFLGKERVWFFAFPLWAWTHEPAFEAQHFLWPIFAIWDGPGTPNGPGGNPSKDAEGRVNRPQDHRHGWRVLPLFSVDWWDNRQFRYSILWPIWTSEDIGLDTKYPTHVRSLFPFYASSVSPRHKLYSVFTFFSKMDIYHGDGVWARSVWSFWPLYSYTHGDVSGLRLFPLWDSRDDHESYYVTLLWPLFRGEHSVSSRETVDTFQFLLDPLAVLSSIQSAIAGSLPLGRTEASQSPGWVRQSWWEVAQPQGDPVRFGREAEAHAFFQAQQVARRWYEEGRVGRFWGSQAEDFPPTTQALRYLLKDGPEPPVDAEFTAKRQAEKIRELDTIMGAPAPTVPRRPMGPEAFPLEPRKRTLADLVAEAEAPEDWVPTAPVEKVKLNAAAWPLYKYTRTQRDDLSVSLFHPLFFPDADGSMESQWGSLWNLFLYQNSAEDIGRERALLTWWRRDWNGPARHTELVGVFNYWRIDDQPERYLLTLGGGWLWRSQRSPRKSFHGNMIFAVQNETARSADWWFLEGLVGQDHDEEGRRQWRILWMGF